MREKENYMPEIKGIVVQVLTRDQVATGTDDRIYLGVFGRGGGSEFPLDIRGIDDFERGSIEKYWFGSVWDGDILSGAEMRPYAARGLNNPSTRDIDINLVDYVYLRKHSHKGGNADDQWKMDWVKVTLYGNDSPKRRIFQKLENITLGNEYGLQVWLVEKK
jgi:hypothetical protein